EVLRRGLDFDLGTFQIGPGCAWIDPEVIDNQIGFRAAAMMGVDLQNDPFCQLGELGDPPTIAPGVFEEQPPVTEPAPGQEPPTSKLESVPPKAEPAGDSPVSPSGNQTISATFGRSANPSTRLAGFDFSFADADRGQAPLLVPQTFTAGSRSKTNERTSVKHAPVRETLSDSGQSRPNAP
ncbi:MAG: hypothetical protein VYE64_12705, partial [Planctomycetota bacterium]|nr:hypothetical protein [Planctomycetota bacterium]